MLTAGDMARSLGFAKPRVYAKLQRGEIPSLRSAVRSASTWPSSSGGSRKAAHDEGAWLGAGGRAEALQEIAGYSPDPTPCRQRTERPTTVSTPAPYSQVVLRPRRGRDLVDLASSLDR